MFKRIVVAVDGSETGDRALEAAIELAREQKAALRVVHVTGELLPVGAEALTAERLLESVYDAGLTLVNDAVTKARAGQVDAEPRLIEGGGRTSQAIASEARNWPADILVIGSHGRRGLNRLLLGSVAEEVVRIAPCPVLLIRG